MQALSHTDSRPHSPLSQCPLHARPSRIVGSKRLLIKGLKETRNLSISTTHPIGPGKALNDQQGKQTQFESLLHVCDDGRLLSPFNHLLNALNDSALDKRVSFEKIDVDQARSIIAPILPIDLFYSL